MKCEQAPFIEDILEILTKIINLYKVENSLFAIRARLSYHFMGYSEGTHSLFFRHYFNRLQGLKKAGRVTIVFRIQRYI